MNEELVTLIYGEDAKMMFSGQMLIAYDIEDGVKYGRIHKCDGGLLTLMKFRHIAPLIFKNDVIGYMLITDELQDKMYNSFFLPASNKHTKLRQISTSPIYINTAILTDCGTILSGKCLISPCKFQFPSVMLTFKNKKYTGVFSTIDYSLEKLEVKG